MTFDPRQIKRAAAPSTRQVFSGIGFEIKPRQPRIRDLDHKATATTGSGDSLVVKVTDLWPAHHEFEPSTAEDPSCREAMHVKYVYAKTAFSWWRAEKNPKGPKLTKNGPKHDRQVAKMVAKNDANLALSRRFRQVPIESPFLTHKKPHISAVNRQKLLDFANEHVNKSPQFWEKVLFSDESKFCIFGIKGRKLVLRKQGTALEKENLVPKS
ncbi:transposable element Tc1 transposase [Trichonephila clavipes]|nr:transposable element Tc1 transposase [Trichonephila clavipes]